GIRDKLVTGVQTCALPICPRCLSQGDAFFAVFSSPRACVAAVLQMQQDFEAHGWPGGERVRVRMGIHCGEAARTATGLVGLEVRSEERRVGKEVGTRVWAG